MFENARGSKIEVARIMSRIKHEGGRWLVPGGVFQQEYRTRTEAIYWLGRADHRLGMLWDLICLLDEMGVSDDGMVEFLTGDHLGYTLEELRDTVCAPNTEGWAELKQAIVDALADQDGGAA